MTPPLAWAEGAADSGPPTPPFTLFLLQLLSLEGPERLWKGGRAGGIENLRARPVGRKLRPLRGQNRKKTGRGRKSGRKEERGGDGMGEELHTSKLNL